MSSLREGHANLLCIVPILTGVTEVTKDIQTAVCQWQLADLIMLRLYRS